MKKSEFTCDHCRGQIEDERMAYTQSGGRYHSLSRSIEGNRVPRCVKTEELDRFYASAGRDFFEGTKEQYQERFKSFFGQ